MRKYLTFIICLMLTGSLFGQEKNQAPAAEVKQQQLPSARKIPGITADDNFPNACVDCHVNKPDFNFDARISTMMTGWFKSAEPELLNKAQAAAPAGVTLKGMHPQASAAWKNIPAACIACHKARAASAPAFDSMLHIIHLTGGDKNYFLTAYQGECTNCHKLNVTTGVWTIPSGPEK